MKMFVKRAWSLLSVLAFVSSSWAADKALLINGAGATFPYPLYSKWFAEYSKKNPAVEINYQSIGSGGGIKNLVDQTVDFGASDAPMTDKQLAEAKSKTKKDVLHIPMVLGAVVLTYNLPGGDPTRNIKLTGELLADIFLGKVKKWNDSKIKALNPGVNFPDNLYIMVVHRSDGSGTSAVFTDYLAKVSPEWSKKVGSGTSVEWPVGLGGKGNEGVTGMVKQTPGALGYVELVYAKSNQLPAAALKNKSGNFITPSTASVTAAAEAALKANAIPADFRVSITNSGGADAYPISSFTYLLVYDTMPTHKGKELLGFLDWALSAGQKIDDVQRLSYAPLPQALVGNVKTSLKKIKLQ